MALAMIGFVRAKAQLFIALIVPSLKTGVTLTVGLVI